MKTPKPQLTQFENSLKHLLREYAEALLYALLVALFIRSFVLSAYRIPSLIMAPSLVAGDFIFAYKLPFGIIPPFMEDTNRWGGRSPQRGEVVILSCPGVAEKSCIRRVIGLPGDRVELQGKRLILNGQMAQYESASAGFTSIQDLGDYNVALNESWGGIHHSILIGPRADRENFGPVVVPPGHLWVLSDYRDMGEDSRDWGPVSTRSLEAKAAFIWLSLGWEEEGRSWFPQVRWSRVGLRVD